MKLLIDQNISYRILLLLTTNSQQIHHVRDLGLINADDHTIFHYARANSYDAVITLDDDFVKLLTLLGPPPKIIWIRTGNCSTAVLAEILNRKLDQTKEFIESEEHFLYEIFKP